MTQITFADAGQALILGPMQTTGSETLVEAQRQASVGDTWAKTFADPYPTISQLWHAKAGTVSITNGSTAVVGVGTHFLTDCAPNDLIRVVDGTGKGRVGRVVSVADDTHLTIANDVYLFAWEGLTVAGQPYAVETSSDQDTYDAYDYYDLALACYTMYARTGDTAHRDNARKIVDTRWTFSWCQEGAKTGDTGSGDGWNIAPREASLGGFILRALDGRPEMWDWITGYVRGQLITWVSGHIAGATPHGEVDYDTRDGGYMLLYAVWLAKVHPDPTVRAEFLGKAIDGAINFYVKTQQTSGTWWYQQHGVEWTKPDGSWGHATEPWLNGLMVNALIDLHRLLTADYAATYPTEIATLASSIALAADAWEIGFIGPPNLLESQTTLKCSVYALSDELVQWRNGQGDQRPYSPAASPPDYQYFPIPWKSGWYQHDDPANNTTTDPNAVAGVRQTNSIYLHVIGYAYALTSNVKYLNMGDLMRRAMYGNPASAPDNLDGYQSLHSGGGSTAKLFSQHYRTGLKYSAYRAGITEGATTGAGTADHLALSQQPSGAVSGVALTTQPVVLVRDSGNSTVTSDTSTVTASWVSLTGDATGSGTLTKAAVSGVATFTNLALTWTVASTGYWHFTDGSLTSVNSSTLSLTVVTPPPPDDSNPFGIVPGAPAVYRMARGKAVFGGFRRTLRQLWRWLTLSSSLA